MLTSMGALRPGLAAARSAIVQYLRVPVIAQTQLLSAEIPRYFSEGSSSTYLDKKEVTDRVLDVVKNFQKIDPQKVSETANFQTDLGLDSLDTVELVMAFEEEFALEIPDNDADKIVSTADAIKYISSHPQAK